MAVAQVSVIPLGTATPSVSQCVARAVGVLRGEGGVKYELTAMGTIIEGDLEPLFSVVMKMHEAVLAGGVLRVVTAITIDDRRDKSSSIDGKIKSLKSKL